MNDLIDRQSAVDIVIEYVKKLCEPIGTPEDNEMYSYGRGLLISILLNLKHLPSTQPEIIYCKDCRHNGSFDTDCPINWNGKEYCSFAE